MESGIDTSVRRSSISDTELLRTIGNDLRSLYAEVIKQPMPRNIEAALERIDREERRDGYRTQLVAH
jgi:hypothetical protein